MTKLEKIEELLAEIDAEPPRVCQECFNDRKWFSGRDPTMGCPHWEQSQRHRRIEAMTTRRTRSGGER